MKYTMDGFRYGCLESKFAESEGPWEIIDVFHAWESRGAYHTIKIAF